MRKALPGALPVFLLLVLVGLAGTVAASRSNSEDRGFIGLTAEALSQPGMPVEISNVRVQSNIVTRETKIQYKVMNSSNNSIEELRLILLFFRADRSPRGGQVVHEKVNLQPGEQQQRRLRLSNLLYLNPMKDNARIVVALEGARGDSLSWTSALLPELVAAMKGQSHFQTAVPVVQTFTTPGASQSGACDCKEFCGEDGTCAKLAVKFCGNRGVNTFSCTCGAECSCSFSCGRIGGTLP
ncbi:MAG: hypothetical protein ACE5IP_11520 [Terriglobia bacterium]